MNTYIDQKVDVSYMRRQAYEAFIRGDKEKMRAYITQAMMLDDCVLIYRLVRTPDESGSV